MLYYTSLTLRDACELNIIILLFIVQVPDDTSVPDNKYTGEMYYERIASNKWFMIVQNIKVFQKVFNIIDSAHLYSEL